MLLVAIAAIFQIFLRYQYVQAAGRTWRIDRLTLESCLLPCASQPTSIGKDQSNPPTAKPSKLTSAEIVGPKTSTQKHRRAPENIIWDPPTPVGVVWDDTPAPRPTKSP